MCFVICAPLQGYLSGLGYETALIEKDFGSCNHVWLSLPDGTIIDPTIDQFSTPDFPLPKIYIGPMPEWYHAVIDGMPPNNPRGRE